MISMKQSAEEAREYGAVGGAYPYGLTLRLNDDDLEKLGFTQPPPAGAKLMVQAMVVVTSAEAMPDSDGEMEYACCLQVTDMELTGAPAPTPAATLLYGT